MRKEKNMNRPKKQKLLMLLLLVVFAVLTAVTVMTPGASADIENYQPKIYATAFALLPPVIAIGLALITKEVYSSLFVGILMGGLLYSNFNLEMTINTIFFHEDGGMIYKLSDSWNVGILVFLVVLGILVSLMNKAGGSAAFGKWASVRIKTRVGAPICIIAPISSWAAAVTSSVPEESGINGFTTFLKTIPYNYYALFTIVTAVFLTVAKVDFGLMKKHEINAINGDLYTTPERPFKDGNVTQRHKQKAA